MKIIGNDGREYSSIEECKAAEEALAKKKALDDAVEEDPAQVALKKKKKVLADEIQKADALVDEAYKSYDTTKAEAEEIIRAANEEANKLLRKAAEKVEAATETRMLKIKEFNDKFGPYVSYYTGDKALKEYNEVIKKMRDIFNRTLPWFHL